LDVAADYLRSSTACYADRIGDVIRDGELTRVWVNDVQRALRSTSPRPDQEKTLTANAKNAVVDSLAFIESVHRLEAAGST
jgi:hypothetical protein